MDFVAYSFVSTLYRKNFVSTMDIIISSVLSVENIFSQTICFLTLLRVLYYWRDLAL